MPQKMKIENEFNICRNAIHLPGIPGFVLQVVPFGSPRLFLTKHHMGSGVLVEIYTADAFPIIKEKPEHNSKFRFKISKNRSANTHTIDPFVGGSLLSFGLALCFGGDQ